MRGFKPLLRTFLSPSAILEVPCEVLVPSSTLARGGDGNRGRKQSNAPPPGDSLLFKSDSMPLFSPTLPRDLGGGGFNWLVHYKTTANQLRRNRKKNQKLVEPLVFIATSRQSHIVRNDVTSEGHSKLKAHNAVFGNLWRTITIVTVGFSKVRERSGTEHVVAFWLATLN